MKKKLISKKLYPFWAAEIVLLDVNITKKHRILIDTILHSSEGDQNNTIIFEEVVSFYFINNQREWRHNVGDIEYAEITEIYYLPEEDNCGFEKILIENSTTDYSSFANFWIEMYSSVLVIEAKKLIINGESMILELAK